MTDKSEFQEKVESELRVLDAQIEKFEAKVAEARADARIEHEQTLRDLRTRRTEVETRIEELQSASEEAWEELRGGIESARDTLKTAVENAASKFK
jgi:chromosome segregation ATPase